MGFDHVTLLVFPLGLLLPLVTLVFMVIMNGKKRKVSFDTFFYGIGSFLGSMVAVFISFIILQSVLSSALSVEDYTDGFTLVSIIFSALIAVLCLFCESLKMVTIKHFSTDDKKSFLPSLGFSAGVITAQSGVFFVALNIFEDTSAMFALFTGAFIMITGVVYYVLSYAAEVSLLSGSKGAAYGVSAFYYLMWIGAVLAIRSTTLVAVVVVAFFIISLIFGYVFIKRNGSKVK